ncbi:hypothetical protein PHET_00884 [Paragonimus heterotremus]|uniref:POU domain protein n=1 Tax=Paragonimus heterotremus TaxID=100268 RepID=A0A8J4WUY1_9TREM|nr:hypothetical protein PHET_00884 [Paragonimus heterotremus]
MLHPVSKLIEPDRLTKHTSLSTQSCGPIYNANRTETLPTRPDITTHSYEKPEDHVNSSLSQGDFVNPTVCSNSSFQSEYHSIDRLLQTVPPQLPLAWAHYLQLFLYQGAISNPDQEEPSMSQFEHPLWIETDTHETKVTGMEPHGNKEGRFLSNSTYLTSLCNIGTIFNMNESQYKAVASDTPLFFYPEHRLYNTTIPNSCGMPIAVNKNQVKSAKHLSSVAAFAPVNSDSNEQFKEDQCKSRNGYSKSARLKSLFKTDEPIPNDVELNEICEFARYFKLRRLTLGLTQTQVGTALNAKEGPAYSQSAICRFEKLDVTAKSAKRMKPVLEQWLSETEAIHGRNGKYYDVQLMSQTPRKRKRRTCFSPQALSQLVDQLRKNPYPSKTEMTELSQKLTYDREVIRVWFCNRRQALKMESVSLASTVSEQTGLSHIGDEKMTDPANYKSSI